MNFSEITLAQKPVFDKYLKLHNPQISELTFTNLFSWRDYYRFRYSIINDLLCIVAFPLKGEPYAMMPLGELSRDRLLPVFKELRDYFRLNGRQLVFKKITSHELTYFEDDIKSGASVSYDRDNSDYIYLLSDLLHLKGKKFDGKRNHINKFKKNHEFEYVQLDASLVVECGRIMADWCKEKNCNCQDGDYCERQANTELLENYNFLGCKGALIKVDGRFQAFTVGEMLNNDTAVIHIEKASTSINGLYTLVNQQFCEKEWANAAYINREQDLGLEGLRKAKLSYNPLCMMDKHTLRID